MPAINVSFLCNMNGQKPSEVKLCLLQGSEWLKAPMLSRGDGLFSQIIEVWPEEGQKFVTYMLEIDGVICSDPSDDAIGAPSPFGPEHACIKYF